jgi:hypothetical protein
MGIDEQKKQLNETPPAEIDEALDPEEAKRRAYRKKKPVGPIMKPLSNEELDDLVNDPEIKERDHLADAMPKGREADDFDAF